MKPSQQMMLDDGLPAGCFVNDADRAAAWKGRRLTRVTGGTTRRQEDPDVAAFRKEKEAAERAAHRLELANRKAERREARRIRERQAVSATRTEGERMTKLGSPPKPGDIEKLVANASARKTSTTTAPAPAAPTKPEPNKETIMAKKTNAKIKKAGKKAPAKKAAPAASAAPGKAGGKTRASKPAPKEAAPAGAAKAVRPGSKLEAVVALLKRSEGCTVAEVLKATGWPSVSMPQQARAAGLTLRKEKQDGATRYWAA